MLPSPDFSIDPGHYVSGLRPARRKSYRLEKTTLGDKLIIHNYGHGGAGISLSWGCAEEAREKVISSGYKAGATEVAVLGAGVIGLTAAVLLVEAGFGVTIYAKAFSPNTTSNVAGGQWAPSLVEHFPTAAGKGEFDRIMRNAYRAHESRIGKGFGVYRRDNYTAEESPTFQKVPRDVIPDPERLAHLPFEKLNRPGFRYKTLLIEPPVFLRRMHDDLVAANVGFVPREFTHSDHVASLAESVVINCTGLGSRQIWADELLYPLKGQLVLLPPQLELDYLFSRNGYLFPRSDVVVVGGSQETNASPTPDPARCHEMFLIMKEIFGGELKDRAALPPWFIVDK